MTTLCQMEILNFGALCHQKLYNSIICVFTPVIRIFSLLCVGPPWWTIHRTFGRKVSNGSHFDLDFQNRCYFGQGTIYNLPLSTLNYLINEQPCLLIFKILPLLRLAQNTSCSFIDFSKYFLHTCLLNWVFPVFTEHLLFRGKCSG